MKVVILMVSVVSLFAVGCSSGKVLVLNPGIATTSHVLSMRTLATHLASRGHQVTIVRWLETYEFPELRSTNVTEYVLAVNNSRGDIPMLSKEERARFIKPYDAFWDKGLSFSLFAPRGFITISAMCKTLFQQEELIQHFRDTQFDVAIVDLVFNECGLMLAHNLDVPIVGFWAFLFNGFGASYTQAFTPLSVSPVLVSHLSTPMGFLQRVYNYVIANIGHAYMQMQFYVTESAARAHLGPGPGTAAILANISGMLINSQPPIGGHWLLPSTFIPVGGFHMREKTLLPKGLQSWLDGSGSHGTVVLNFGVHFDSKYIPYNFIQKLLTALGKLKQRVIMKYGGPARYIPSNVKLLDSFPQRDVIAHPNVVLFITHCGVFSVLEALHHGVPLVGMPMFADQMDSLQRLKELGVMVQIEKTSSADEIHASLVEGLTNPHYKEAAVQMSSHLQSLPVPPLQKATWLLEHVMNTSGAHHYKIPAQHLNSLQYFGLDVIAFILITICVLVMVLFTFSSKIFSRNLNKEKFKIS